MESKKVELPKPQEGKDELNLAEFPLCAISSRLHADQKTLTFEDRVWDRNRGETITRQLLITASDEYGLPTAHDDEVLLGLIQLSRLTGFSDRRVSFTRYQLIELLGWRNETKSYERIEKSLNRWIGVTLYYQNAWWCRERQCWVDEKFHLLDNITLFDREKLALHRMTQSALPFSSFTWNESVYRSFRAGNLKSLDFEFFKQLEGAIAKRLYRFLDKRFFHRTRWEFNLQELCWEHIGLARSYDAANLKRKLRPAIAELERNRFVMGMPETERFRKLASGEWCVVFERAGKVGAMEGEPKSHNQLLCQAMIDRGVTASTAGAIMARFPPERVQSQLEVFDWLVNQKDIRVGRNPAGFLVSAIRGEYAAPKEFNERRDKAALETKAKEVEERRKAKILRDQLQSEIKARARLEAIATFWNSLSTEERLRLEIEAVGSAGTFEKTLLERGGSLGKATRQKLLDEFALRTMEATGGMTS